MPQQLCYFIKFLITIDIFIVQAKPIALVGTIILPYESIRNGTLLITDGYIAAVGKDVAIPHDAIYLNTDGIILPGLIDLHNHLTWNIFPRWKPIKEFHSRYEWQQKPAYKSLLQTPHRSLMEAGLSCEMQRYAEVKAITQGVTSVIGSLRHPCNRGLVRNLDDDPTFGQVLYNVFPLLMTDLRLKEADKVLSSEGAQFIHLAEGSPSDAATASEFLMLKARGLLKPGVSLIHGVALKDNDFEEMANASVGLVWSPRSNLELYGDTTNLGAALKNNVTTAIAPDWSLTGSDGLLSELNFAASWNTALERPLFDDRLLLSMATVNAAKLAHLDKYLGILKEGYIADVLVLKANSNQSNLDPFWSVTHSVPEDVLLVLIDGEAVYGEPKLMKQLVSYEFLESLKICGAEKSISCVNQNYFQHSFRQTQSLLDNALRRWGRTLGPLSECGL